MAGVPKSGQQLGGGYGASNLTDQYSGKPLLTYNNPVAKSSQLLGNRVAPDFNPTVPQKLDASILENGRMPESASQAVRQSMGAEPDQQLDHEISLELGGSNATSNLNLENTNASGVQPSLELENATAKKVVSGQISYIDGQKLIAEAKGVQLPDDTNFSSTAHPLAQDYNNPSPNQVGTKSQTPSTLDKVGSFVKGALSKLSSFITSVGKTPNKASAGVFNALGGQAVVHPIQTLNNIVNQAKQGADATLSNLGHAAAQVVTNGEEAQQGKMDFNDPKSIGATINLMTAAASTLFYPISETFNIASQLPVIKPAADATGLIFSKAGQLTGWESGKILDNLVAQGHMKQSTADTLKAPIEAMGTLVGQITLGAYVYEKVGDQMMANEKTGGTGLTQEQATEIASDASEKSQTIEDAPLPKPSPTLSDISEAKPAPKVADVLPPKSVENEITKPEEKTPVESEIMNQPEGKPKTRVTNQVKTIEGTGEVKTRGLSKSVEAGAIQNGLAETLGDLPEYKSIDMKDQAEKVQAFIESDPQGARDVAMGEKNAPKGIIPEAVHTALRLQAAADGDGDLARDLANSKLTSQATTFGQRIQALKGANPEDPVAAIREVQDAREKASQKRIAEETQKAQDSIKKATSSRGKIDWSSFVDSITC